jgi:recombination protein RecT
MQPQNVTTRTTPAEIKRQAIQKSEAKTALDRIRQYAEMDEVKRRFINLLGEKDGRAYVESIVIAVSNNESLQGCTPKSIMVSAMRAASLKLSVDPILKQAHLVAYGKEAQLIPDYHGLVQLSVSTGYYEKAPHVSEVWEGEEVKVNRFTGEVEIGGEKTSGEVIGWCGYFKAKNGTERWLYMTNEECDEHGKKYNPGGYNSKRSAWNTDRDKMRRKTVLRQLVSRWGNFSPQVQSVLMQDEAAIEVQAEDLPDDNIQASPAPEMKNSTAANISILSGGGNPDPVKDDTWKSWENWRTRAGDMNIRLSSVSREATTDFDLITYIAEVAPLIEQAEQEPA